MSNQRPNMCSEHYNSSDQKTTIKFHDNAKMLANLMSKRN